MPTTHRFFIRARLRYQLSQAGWLLLNMAAMKAPSQRVIRESVQNNLGIPFREHQVPMSTTRFHGIAAPAGPLEIAYETEVERDIAGSAEYEQGDYAAALRYWQPLLAALEPGSKPHTELAAAIARTERLAKISIPPRRL